MESAYRLNLVADWHSVDAAEFRLSDMRMVDMVVQVLALALANGHNVLCSTT